MIKPKENIARLTRLSSDCINRVGKVIRLDKNERTTPLPQDHFKEILRRITPEEIVAYPELEPFYKKLAKWLGVDRAQVLLISGSDTGIRAVYEVYVGKSDEVIIFPPTYAMYAVYCDMFGARKNEIVCNQDFSLPVNRALSAINARTKLIAVVNPNHTGKVVSEAGLIKILKAARKNEALVLIDEAYHHFYGQTALPFIKKFDNLIIVRTFSKAFGVAGLRIGYLISNREIIKNLSKVRLTHEITSLSARFGEYLLDHSEIMEEYVAQVNKSKAYLLRVFAGMGITAEKSHANFVLAKLPGRLNGESIVKLLRERKIRIGGPFTAGPLKGYIRITVGPISQIEGFVSALNSVLSGLTKK